MARPETPLVRLTSLREAIEAACGDWHEITSLLSIQVDLHWLLAQAERPEIAALLTLPERQGEQVPR